MYLHISQDEKFLEPFFIPNINRFSQANHKFVIYTYYQVEKLKHIKDVNIPFAVYGSENFWHLVGDTKKYQAIFIHYLSDVMIDFVLKCPLDVPIVWVFWGADGFKLEFFYDSILCSQNQKLYKRISQQFFHIDAHPYRTLKNIYKYVVSNRSLMQRKHKLMRAMQRINYFCHYLEEEHSFLVENFGLQAKFVEFNYGTIDQILEGTFDEKREMVPVEKYAVVGNNAGFTNNHFEAFEYLTRCGFDDLYIYCPLSYVATKGHVDEVIKSGYHHFGKRFKPITDFLPMATYNRIVQQATLIVQNQYRSQGGATIWGAFHNGIPLVMNEKNSLYKFFDSRGADIIKLSAMGENNLHQALVTIDHKKNNSVLERYFGSVAVEKKYRNLFSLLENPE
jgi:dTDP-N-acetylfucosamine:lipid II N-acetylfucosaminyltransferase